MQDVNTHKRYYPLHHFILIPLTIGIFIWSIIQLIKTTDNISLFLIATILLITSNITRIYALKNQDRIIRLEMRLRYFQLTQQTLSAIEQKLTMKQLVALRFAGDDELLSLIDRTINENLSPGAIKKNIKNWQADNHRV
ncbi:MAG: hypothetical protein H0V30_10950 [Chitinophagaceae bacterium]|jgi:uncharacterized protein YqhQ|nr:hypothetical protein [Chitinophagaceae bacterium]